VRLSPLGTSATVGLLRQPRMIDDDYGAVGGMRIGKGNRSTRRKPAPVQLRPPQIPHDLTWDQTRVAAVGSQRLTAWAVARPQPYPYYTPVDETWWSRNQPERSDGFHYCSLFRNQLWWTEQQSISFQNAQLSLRRFFIHVSGVAVVFHKIFGQRFLYCETSVSISSSLVLYSHPSILLAHVYSSTYAVKFPFP
jgi:hypothetical protein